MWVFQMFVFCYYNLVIVIEMAQEYDYLLQLAR